MAHDQDYIDGTNLYDVPLAFDPSNMRHMDETLSVAFKLTKMPNNENDFHMYEVDAKWDMDQVHDILQGWEMTTRVRGNGRRDFFYRHSSRNRQFRSLLELKDYIRKNIEPEVAQELEEKSSEYFQGFGVEKYSEARLVAAEANQTVPKSSTEGTFTQVGSSLDEIEVARILAVDLARVGK